MILQVKWKKQIISECENKTRCLSCLSLRRKSHPSGGIHARWYLPSEIVAAVTAVRRPISARNSESLGTLTLKLRGYGSLDSVWFSAKRGCVRCGTHHISAQKNS